MTARELGPRRGDGQLQPGDGLHRLRHLRPPLLRAADRRGRARGLRAGAPRGRDRPVRRPDAAEARPRARGGRACRCSARRSTRSTSPRTAAASAPCCAGSAIKHPPYGTALSAEEAAVIAEEVGFPLLVRPSYVLGGRAMEICYSTEDLGAYLEAQRQGRPGAPAAARPLPRERDRGRRRRARRRRGGPRRRDHAARRGGRRPLRRLGLRDPADEPRRGDARGDPRDDRADRARARRDRPDQHPVRGRRRRALRDRGQPARLAHRPLRLQGDRRAAGQARLPADAGREAGRPGAAASARPSTSASRRRCCPSPASPAPTRCSARR